MLTTAAAPSVAWAKGTMEQTMTGKHEHAAPAGAKPVGGFCHRKNKPRPASHLHLKTRASQGRKGSRADMAWPCCPGHDPW